MMSMNNNELQGFPLPNKKAMTTQSQLILACEKLLGWKRSGEYWIRNSEGIKHEDLPAITFDLVHELWSKLTPEQKESYIRKLGDIVCKYGLPSIVRALTYEDFIKLEDATAEQRLAALVETIGGMK